MWAYIFRKLVYNVPVYLTIVLLVMAALRVHDPVYSFLGKNANPDDIIRYREKVGLDQPFWVQYARFLTTFDLRTESWDQHGRTVGEILRSSVGPSLSITVPALVLTTLISICVGIVSAYFRGRIVDRTLVVGAVLGMSVSFLVYIILGQYFGAYVLNRSLGWELFAIEGYEPGLSNWVHYCLLPVIISVIVGMGYDTRYYRAVMVEESQRDYITTALAKGATKSKVMFVHMLKNAMIPIVTRVAISLPFLIMGSILLESFFGIPGMGRTLIAAVRVKDFPVVQAFTAIFAAVYILSIILTDVLYAVFDPRVRLS
ncbi:MAG: ABC transporter permease [Planctomycetaceae bacterium]|nr:ABC transporter permease [Planctomycetaceae bacterium]